MIKKWQLIHAPSTRDQLRHRLLLDCEMKDVLLVIKKLGASCSRPQKESGNYSYSLYLFKADQILISRTREIIESMSENKTQILQTENSPEVSGLPKNIESVISGQKNSFVLDKDEVEGDFKTPFPKKVTQDDSVDTEQNITPQNLLQQNKSDKIEEKNIREKNDNIIPGENKQAQLSKPQPPKPQPPDLSSLPEINLDVLKSPVTSPESKIMGEEKIDLDDKKQQLQRNVAPQNPFPKPSAPPSSVSSSFAPPSSRSRSKIEEEKKEEEKQQEAKKGEIASQIKKESSVRTKCKWPIELPLNPTLGFQTLIAGPHNRFAHAAAMAVVENPGVMYNPLLIFGPQGIGKSHFIHAIGYGLSSSIGQNNIFVTHAARFSKGIDLAIERNTISSLENMLKEMKVIIIDDIDLLYVTEKNRPYIHKILNECIDSNKQIVFSSMFPPNSLAPLEESIGFQFTQGWMVDIKVPNTQTYRLILNQMLSSMDLKISEDDIKNLFMSRMMDFRNVAKIIYSAKKLEKYLSPIDSSLVHRDFISILLGTNSDDETFPGDDEINSAQPDLSAKDQWFKWGMFYPKGFKNHAMYALANIKFFASSELKINLAWEQIFFEEYNPDEIYGIPFKIGEISLSSHCNGVIVMGPQSTSALGAKEAEFRTLTEKIIESFSLKVAWLDSSKLKARSNYLRAIMELL